MTITEHLENALVKMGVDVDALPDRLMSTLLGALCENVGSGGGTGGGGSSAPSDWNASEGQPGHVLNRTHWEAEEVSNKPLSLTWDGNTTGLTSVMGYLYKISDMVFTDDEIKLMTVTLNVGDSIELGSAWDMLLKSDDVVGTDVIIFVREDGAVLNDTVFAEKGIYVFSMDGAYVSSITTTEPIELVVKIVHKIPDKFLPENPVVYITISDRGFSHTYDEIMTLLSSGKVVKAALSGIDFICQMTDTGDGLAFGGFIFGDGELAYQKLVVDTDMNPVSMNTYIVTATEVT